MGCHFLLQEIFRTQGLNPGLPHCRQMLYHLSHQGTNPDETCPNRLCTFVHCSSEMLPEISVLVWATVTKIPRLNGLNKIYLFLSFKDGSFKFQFQGWKFKMLVDLVSGEGPLPVLQKPNFLLRRRQWHPTPVLLPGKSMDGGAW